MITFRFVPALIILALLAAPAVGSSPAGPAQTSPAPAAGPIVVGYGRADITPALGTACALGLDDELLEVFDPIYVRAIWLELGGKTVLVMVGDVIGVNGDDLDEFSALVGKAVGVAAQNVLITSTHTHETANSRWSVGRLLRPYGLEDKFSSLKFKDQYVSGLLEAARQAKASAAPCEMAYSESPVVDIASNRRIPIEGGKAMMRPARPPADLRAKPVGKIDPLLRAVLFRSLKDGSIIGIVNYNCHPTSAGGDELGYATGDFPGVGMALVEREAGNVKLLHLTGTAGEINPGKYVLSDSVVPADRKRDIQLMARRYADAIKGALGAAKDWQPASRLDLSRESFTLSLRDKLPSPEEAQKRLAAGVEQYKQSKAAGAATQPGRLRGLGETYLIQRSRDGRLVTQAAALRLGDVYFTFLPGEDMLMFGEELRDFFGRPKLLNVTLALDIATSYVVPQLYFDQGGYEPGATRLAPAAYVELRDKMIGLLEAVGLAPAKP